MNYVYVLHSESDRGLYIGYSTNLKRRLSEHFAGEARATSFRRPLKLIYYEAYLCDADAIARERFLKSGSGRRFLDKQMKHYFCTHSRREAT